jgi:xanthine phosphoribosyltransferase
LVRSARASIAGIGIAIEKSFQKGGGLLREEGLTLCSLAKVEALEDGVITLARADA